jgi:hypothetical protein
MIRTTIENADTQHARGKFEKNKALSMSDYFSDRTRKVMFWEQFATDKKDFYCGG